MDHALRAPKRLAESWNSRKLGVSGRQACSEFIMFPYINLIRFAAAFWILIFHAQLHFGSLPALWMVRPLIEQGVLAMTLFFMLSGFILSHRYGEFNQTSKWFDFYTARFKKIYPVYFFMGLVTAVSLASAPESFAFAQGSGFGYFVWLFVMVFIFILGVQAWFPAFLDLWNFSGSWSLSVEAFFYLFFPWLRRALGTASSTVMTFVIYGTPVMLLFFCVALIAGLRGETVSPTLFYAFPVFRIPEFILGIAGYCYFIERKSQLGRLKACSGISLFLGVFFIYTVGDLPGSIDYGAFFALPFLLSFVLLSRPFAIAKPISAVFNYLGGISYCVYIVQFGTVPLMLIWLDGLSVGQKWFCFVAINSLFAVLVHHLVERPASRVFKGASPVR